MRIGMVTETYKPTINGVVISIDTFASELRRRGHRVTIIAPHHPAATPQPDVIRVPAWPLPGTTDYFLIRGGTHDFASILSAHKFDLLHGHHIFRMSSLGLAAARALGIPFVQTYHTLLAEYTHYVPLLKPLVRRYVIHRSETFLNQVDRVIVPSPSIGRLLKTYGVATPITAIPTGLDLSLFRHAATDSELRRLDIDPQRPMLLFVGRLAEEKNVSLLLEAFARIHHTFPDAQLVLLGDGPEAAKYKSWARTEGLAASVIFTGFLAATAAKRIFLRATMFTFPSITDTQGIVIQEAMAAGLPIVAVRKYGPADYLDDMVTGRLVPNQVGPFAQAVIELLGNAQARRTMAVAAKRAAQNFTIRRTTDRLLTLYRDVLATAQTTTAQRFRE